MATFHVQVIVNIEADDYRDAVMKARWMQGVFAILRVTNNDGVESHTLEAWCEGCNVPLFEVDERRETADGCFICSDCLQVMVD